MRRDGTPGPDGLRGGCRAATLLTAIDVYA
jgi:hypothetical protein